MDNDDNFPFLCLRCKCPGTATDGIPHCSCGWDWLSDWQTRPIDDDKWKPPSDAALKAIEMDDADFDDADVFTAEEIVEEIETD
jgi:hypothetical protein